MVDLILLKSIYSTQLRNSATLWLLRSQPASLGYLCSPNQPHLLSWNPHGLSALAVFPGCEVDSERWACVGSVQDSWPHSSCPQELGFTLRVHFILYTPHPLPAKTSLPSSLFPCFPPLLSNLSGQALLTTEINKSCSWPWGTLRLSERWLTWKPKNTRVPEIARDNPCLPDQRVGWLMES